MPHRLIKKINLTPEGPLNLAIARIVIFGALFTISLRPAEIYFRLTQISPELRVPPYGLGWTNSWFPSDLVTIQLLVWLFRLSSLSALLGLFSRSSATVSIVTACYVLSLPMFFGKVLHLELPLIWFGAVLAVSRCGDFLSLDYLLRRIKGQGSSRACSIEYTFPLRIIWLLFGIIYFFPGIWKLTGVGQNWLLEDGFKYLLQSVWLTNSRYLPAIRLDHFPLICRLSAAITILFEIFFVLLVFIPKFRLLLFVSGIGLHVGIKYFLNIHFDYLLLLYLLLLDWNQVFLKLRIFREKETAYSDKFSRGLVLVCLVGLTIFFGNTYAGLNKRTNGWPFSCFPLFATPHTDKLEQFTFRLAFRDSEREIPGVSVLRKQRFQLSKFNSRPDGAEKDAVFAKFIEQYILQHPKVIEALPGADSVRLYLSTKLVEPEKWDLPPVRELLIHEYRLTPSSKGH